MTLYYTVALWGIFSGLVFFICLWSLGYLVMVGIVVESWIAGRLTWQRAIHAIITMILLWPVVLGGALSKSKLPNGEQ